MLRALPLKHATWPPALSTHRPAHPSAVWPAVKTHLVSNFPTRQALIDAVMASCHLPTISDGSFTVNFQGRGLHIDGGLLSVLTPPPNAAHTVLVCRCVQGGGGQAVYRAWFVVIQT
jgi:hypothetical protein